MRGQLAEHKVTLEVESSGATRFSAKAAISRRDFGASGNVGWDNYGVMIGERVDIEVEVEAVRQAAAAVSFLSDVRDLTASRG